MNGMMMIERVARALFRADQDWYGDLPDSEFKDDHAGRYRRAARAAIAAMREPTEAMVKAGTIGWDALDGSPIKPMFDPTNAYRRMIDEILKEQPDGLSD